MAGAVRPSKAGFENRHFRVMHTRALPSRHRCLAWPSPHPAPPRRPVFRAVCWELPPAVRSLPSTCLRPVSVLCSLIDSLAFAPCPLVGWGTPAHGLWCRGSWSPRKPSWADPMPLLPQLSLGACVSAQLCSCVPSQALWLGARESPGAPCTRPSWLI